MGSLKGSRLGAVGRIALVLASEVEVIAWNLERHVRLADEASAKEDTWSEDYHTKKALAEAERVQPLLNVVCHEDLRTLGLHFTEFMGYISK